MPPSISRNPTVSVEKPANTFEVYRKFMISSGINLRNRNIGDFGCAKGIFLEGLVGNNNCSGYDISAVAVQECKRRIRAANVSFSVLDLNESQPAPERRYDLITLFDVIEHLTNFAHLRSIIAQNLEVNGYVVVTTPNANSFVRLLGVAHLFSGEADPTHTVLFTPYTLDFFLRRCGLVKVSLSTPYSFHFRNNFVTKNILLGGQIFAVYQKAPN